MFARILTADQIEALESVERAWALRMETEIAYEQSVVHAYEIGCSNAAIAERVGQSETAVRTWLRRRGYRREV